MKYFKLALLLLPSFFTLSANENDIHRVRGYSVVSSPDIGKDRSYSGSDLVVKMSGVNRSLKLLQQIQNLTVKSAKSPLVDIGGKVGFKSSYENDQTEFTRLFEFDVTSNISKNIILFSSIGLNNGKLKAEQVFITIGNLDISPLFVTAGKFTPSGGFGNGNNLSNKFVKVNNSAISVEYYASNVHIKSFTFNNKDSKSLSYGASINIEKKLNSSLKAVIHSVFISNILDVNDFKVIGNYDRKKTPVIGIRGDLTFASKTKIGVYYTTLIDNLDSSQGTYDGKAAQPSAFDINISQPFTAFDDKSFNLVLTYGKSYEAYFTKLPKQKISCSLTTNIWKSSTLGFEIVHEKYYPVGTKVSTGESSKDYKFGKESTKAIVTLNLFF